MLVEKLTQSEKTIPLEPINLTLLDHWVAS